MSQFQTHGLEPHEVIRDGRCGCRQQLRLKQGRGLRAGPARAGLGRRELNQAPGLELQKQRAGGHVFESAGPVAPVPKLAEMTRKGRAMPVGVLRHQGAQLRQIIARERAALEADRFHCPQLLGHPGPRVQQKMSKLQALSPLHGERENAPAPGVTGASPAAARTVEPSVTGSQRLRGWAPWLILTVFIMCWGLPQFKAALDKLAAPKLPVPHLHQVVQRVPPVAPAGAKPEEAEFRLNVLSATGTGILLAAIVAGLAIGCSLRELVQTYLETLWRVRFSLLTIAAMLALGNVTKYSGTDATLGLALAHTGTLYPFFGTLLGWLGVALTGSDTSSNVLFGSLQKITAEQTGLSPILMAAANSSG